jgi:palmitoyl transferase
MRHHFSAVCLTAALAFSAGATQAQAPAPAKGESSNCDRLWEFLQYNCKGAANAWNGDSWDLYLPGYIHHGSGTYSPEKLATLNSSAWGGGIGKRYVDENNRTHFIYTAVYQDSHYKPEYFAGYGWLAHWKPWDDAGLRLGGGFTATVTLKSSYSSYAIPVPVLLPIAEIAWDKFSIMGLYVPRISSNGGNGDVLLVWGRYAF